MPDLMDHAQALELHRSDQINARRDVPAAPSEPNCPLFTEFARANRQRAEDTLSTAGVIVVAVDPGQRNTVAAASPFGTVTVPAAGITATSGGFSTTSSWCQGVASRAISVRHPVRKGFIPPHVRCDSRPGVTLSRSIKERQERLDHAVGRRTSAAGKFYMSNARAQREFNLHNTRKAAIAAVARAIMSTVPRELHHRVVVAWGANYEGLRRRRRQRHASYVRPVRQQLASRVPVILLDEYRSSKSCPVHRTQAGVSHTNGGQTFQCTSCNAKAQPSGQEDVSRDTAAAMVMWDAATEAVLRGTRPLYLCPDAEAKTVRHFRHF